MCDVDLYRQVLGLEAPWTVTRVDLSVTEERVDVVGPGTRPASAGPVRRVGKSCPSTTTRPNGRGATSTPVNS